VALDNCDRVVHCLELGDLFQKAEPALRVRLFLYLTPTLIIGRGAHLAPYPYPDPPLKTDVTNDS